MGAILQVLFQMPSSLQDNQNTRHTELKAEQGELDTHQQAGDTDLIERKWRGGAANELNYANVLYVCSLKASLGLAGPVE